MNQAMFQNMEESRGERAERELKEMEQSKPLHESGRTVKRSDGIVFLFIGIFIILIFFFINDFLYNYLKGFILMFWSLLLICGLGVGFILAINGLIVMIMGKSFGLIKP